MKLLLLLFAPIVTTFGVFAAYQACQSKEITIWLVGYLLAAMVILIIPAITYWITFAHRLANAAKKDAENNH